MTTPEEQKSSSITLHCRSISVSTIIKIVIKFGATAIGADSRAFVITILFARNQRKLCCDKFTAANQPLSTGQLPRDTSQLTVEFTWNCSRYRPQPLAMVLMHSPTSPYISKAYSDCSTETISPTLEAVHLRCSTRHTLQ